MKTKLIMSLGVWVILWLALGSRTAQAQTTDLNTYLSSTTAPVGTTLEWHNAIPVSVSNLISGTAVSGAGPGTYYVVYNYGTCYSNPVPIRVVQPICPATTVDLTALVSTAPTGSTISYHTSATATMANELSSPTSATAGTYYVAYKDGVGCYSNTSPIVVLGVTCVPDLTPIIYARPSTVYGTTNISVVVDVFELLNVPTTGPITVRLTKDAKVSLVWNGGATTVDGHSVQNGAWSFDGVSNLNYYIFTTSQVLAGDMLSFGLMGVLTPGATSGALTLSSVIIGGSGGEVRVNNNVDADKIDYFQQ